MTCQAAFKQEAPRVLLRICQETFDPYQFLNIQDLRGETRLSWG